MKLTSHHYNRQSLLLFAFATVVVNASSSTLSTDSSKSSSSFHHYHHHLDHCRDDPNFRYIPTLDEPTNCEWIGRRKGGCNYPANVEDNNNNNHNNSNNNHNNHEDTVGKRYCPVTCRECPKEISRHDIPKITTDQLCYAGNHQNIVITFENPQPQMDDWWGIYPANIDISKITTVSSSLSSLLENKPQEGEEPEEDDENENENDDPLLAWTWLSGNQDSRTRSLYDTFIFTASLPPGMYKAVLARKQHDGEEKQENNNNNNNADDNNLFSFAQSPPFQIHPTACTGRRELSLPSSASSSSLSSTTLPNKCISDLLVQKSEYTIGESISIQLVKEHQDGCPSDDDNNSWSEDAFVAIYDADMDVKEIRGDSNYLLWMWTCGNQFCHSARTVADQLTFDTMTTRTTMASSSSSSSSSSLLTESDDTNAEILASSSKKSTTTTTILLPEGTYKAHLVMPIQRYHMGGPNEEIIFGSAMQSEPFSVISENSERVSK